VLAPGTETPPAEALPDPEHPELAQLRSELDAALADALRRATTRAEHIRLSRIQSLVLALTGTTAA
jgi:hypothetical protein